MHISKIQEQGDQIAGNFKRVAESFGKAGGHEYLVIDPNNPKLTRFTTNKEEATSFKEITKLVNTILNDTTLDVEVKYEILKGFNVLKMSFESKRLNGLAKIFFSSIKNKQLSKADETIKLASRNQEIKDYSRSIRKIEDSKLALKQDAGRVGTDEEFSQKKALFSTFIDERRSDKAVKKELEDWIDRPFCELSDQESFVDLMAQLNTALESEDRRAQIDKLNTVYLEACALYRSLHQNKPLGGEEKSQIMILILSKSTILPSFLENSVDALTPSDLESEIPMTLSTLSSMMIYVAKKTADVQSIHEEH